MASTRHDSTSVTASRFKTGSDKFCIVAVLAQLLAMLTF